MDDRWFDEFTYQIVIDKKYLSAKELAAYEEKPIELEPWDPMGSLAL
jgi:bleomycin hydrolase